MQDSWRSKESICSTQSSGTSVMISINLQNLISGRIGMLILYAPAFLAGLASFFLLPDEGFRFSLLRSALTIHFFKRLLEVIQINSLID